MLAPLKRLLGVDARSRHLECKVHSLRLIQTRYLALSPIQPHHSSRPPCPRPLHTPRCSPTTPILTSRPQAFDWLLCAPIADHLSQAHRTPPYLAHPCLTSLCLENLPRQVELLAQSPQTVICRRRDERCVCIEASQDVSMLYLLEVNHTRECNAAFGFHICSAGLEKPEAKTTTGMIGKAA